MQLQARIVIMTESYDKPFYITKDADEFKGILSGKFSSLGNLDIQVGDKIIIREVECTIKGYYVRFYSEINEPHNYGINLHGVGVNYPYNIDIVILVNDEAIKLRAI